MCSLTIEDIVRIRIGACCHYCQVELPDPRRKKDHGWHLRPCLDRIDNAGDYTADNVVPCCALCNDARGHLLTLEEFEAAMKVRLARTGPGNAWTGVKWRTALGGNP